jgi:type 1 fimbria pilin
MVRRLRRLMHSYSSFALLGVALVFLLSGCAGAARGATLQPTATAPAATPAPAAVGYALLMPQPSGEADLTWDPATDNTLTVNLAVMGLAPADPANYQSAPYPVTISNGSCQKPGNVVHQLTQLSADQNGAASSATEIKGVAGGIPAKGWSIVIHAPGAAAANQGAALACAPVLNPHASTTEKQSVKTRFFDTHMQNGPGTYGKAKLTLTGTTLTVNLSLIGLAPGSKHEAHIHSGSCAKQGPVVHPLNVVTADSSGRAQVETTIEGVQAIPADWYINVHSSADVKTQTGFQPIACGDVYNRAPPGK